MKKKLLAVTAIAGAMAMGASAATTTNLIEQWTFDGGNPETGTNGTIISTWSTNAPNSVPSSGVLRYADTTDSNWGNSQLLPDIDTSAIDKMIWTIELADLKVSAGSNFRFSTLTSAGGEVRPELELTAWGAGVPYTFSPDMEYNGNTDVLSGTDANVSQAGPGGTLGGPLTIVATWDFVNNTMTMQVGSNSVMSITPTANMAATIGTITGFRMYPRTIAAGDYLDLDSVTIETVETAVDPPPPAEFVTVEQWNFDGTNTAEGVNGLIVSTFSNTPPNSVPSPGILRLETPGSSQGDGFDGLKASSIKKLIMEVDLADFLIGVGTSNGVPNNTGVDVMRHEIITDAGQLKLELNSFGGNGNFAPDLEQGLGNTDDLDVTLLSWAEQTNESPIILTATWDFENLEMTLETSGSAASSTTVPATNLANIVNLWRYRTTSSTSVQFGSFQELNSVTIKYESYFEQGTYEFWITQYPAVGAATNRTDNPDGDAWLNVYEYGLNGDPTVSNTVIQPVFQQAGSNMEYIHVQRNDDTNLVYTLEITDDLVNGTWTNAGYTVTGVNTNSGIADFDTVTNSIPADVKDQQFIKLIIE